jgi:hypothetical protein
MAEQSVSIKEYSVTTSFSNLTSLSILCTTSSVIVTSSTSSGTGVTLTSGQSLTLQASDGFTLPTITITIVSSGVFGIVSQ